VSFLSRNKFRRRFRKVVESVGAEESYAPLTTAVVVTKGAGGLERSIR
jgi:hypothetical protein